MSVIKVVFVCLGNICRSPLAEGVFKKLVDEKELQAYFEIDSCGTSAYHIGKFPDERMRDVAFSHDILLTSKARQFQKNDLVSFDYIIPMDASNCAAIMNDEFKSKIFLMRDFDLVSHGEKNVPDPYYGGLAGFEEVYQIVYRSCVELLKRIRNDYKI